MHLLGEHIASDLGAEHPSVAKDSTDRKPDFLTRCADGRGGIVDEVVEVSEVQGPRIQVRRGAAVPLLQIVGARHALGLHADDLWLSVDMADKGKQREAAEEGEQHEAVEGQQHFVCHCLGSLLVLVWV